MGVRRTAGARSHASPGDWRGAAQDPGPFRFPWAGRLVSEPDIANRQALQVNPHFAVGKEHERLHEGTIAGLTKGPLAEEQTLEPSAFPVGHDERAFVALFAAIVFPDPILRVAGDHTWASLDFDKEDPLRAGDEQIGFIDGAVIGDELEVGPSEVSVLGYEPGMNEVERLLFRNDCRRNDLFFSGDLGYKAISPKVTPVT